MEIIETHELKNLPNDIKLIESLLSSSLGEFVSKNTANLNAITITFLAGTPSKIIKREVK